MESITVSLGVLDDHLQWSGFFGIYMLDSASNVKCNAGVYDLVHNDGAIARLVHFFDQLFVSRLKLLGFLLAGTNFFGDFP